MNQFTTEIVEALVKKQDITEVFRTHLETAVNTLLATELTAFLDYEKYDWIGINSGNSRNGSYSRTLHTEYGDLTIQILRDRNGEFKQQTVAPYKRSNDTPQTISNMTKVVTEQVEAFNKRTLNERYICVYLDATYIPVRRETVSKEAVYIAVGIREDGSKEVLSYTIAPTESAYNWQELLTELKERGVEEVLLFISDGLKGMVDAISTVFPKAQYQTGLVHVARNISHKVRVEDRQEICDDFKTIYKAANKEAGQLALNDFCSKWQKAYPKVVKSLHDNAYLLTFYGFPKAIWRSIYSTNLIESFNKKIKKYTKCKEQFPNEESLERFLVSQFEDYNQNFATRCHIGFNQARAELEAMFEWRE